MNPFNPKLLRFLAPVLALAALLCVHPAALAQKPQNVTAAEMALLPEYCVDTQGFNYGDASWNTSPRASYWVGLMGPTFWHHHHYCWALVKKHRALQPGLAPELRNGRISNALGDLEYVVQHATPNFPLLPEVYYRMGEFQLLLGNRDAAKEALDNAVRRKPDYWPAYLLWADTLSQLKMRQEAMQHLELGLRVSPNTVQLRNAYRALGGDPDAIIATSSVPRGNLPEPAAAASAASGPPSQRSR